RAHPPPSAAAQPPPPRRSSPSGDRPPGSAASARWGCGCGRSSAPSRGSGSACGESPAPGPTREGGGRSTAGARAPPPVRPRRARRRGPTPATTRLARSRRAALAPSRPAAGRPAGAARASFEDDQDLALLHDLALLDAHLSHLAGARSGDRDLHLHPPEDEQLALLGDPPA